MRVQELRVYRASVALRRGVYGASRTWPRAEEARVWVDIALECGYLNASAPQRLTARCDCIAGGLVNMMQAPAARCGPATLAREGSFLYS